MGTADATSETLMPHARPFALFAALLFTPALGACGALSAAEPKPAEPVPIEPAPAPEPAPSADEDGDGLADASDRCPSDAEDVDGFADEDGCPELDNDGDRVIDPLDQCSGEAETWNDHEDDDGCPDVLPTASGAVARPSVCGDARACKGAGDERWKAGDVAAAERAYRSACGLGDAGACVSEAIVIGNRGAKDYELPGVVARYRWGCEHRVREGCQGLAAMLAVGQGVPRDEVAARARREQACDLGAAESCRLLGRPVPAPAAAPARADVDAAGQCVDAAACGRAALDAFVGKRVDEAARHASRGCELGAADACGVLGRLRGDAQRYDEAARLDRKACTGGWQPGCHNLALLMKNGQGLPVDRAGARALLDAACKTGLQPSCNELAAFDAKPAPAATPAPAPAAPAIDYGPIDRAFDALDYATAARLTRPLCDKGDMRACADHASASWELHQEATAVSEWDKACQGGIGWACSELARCYFEGDHVARDADRGLALARRGCDLDSGEACTQLGRNQLDGDRWLEKACRLEDWEGCSWLAFMLFETPAPKGDPARAVAFATKACDHEVWTSCTLLGEAYERGKGVERDLEQAREYYRRACVNADADACAARQLLDR